MKTKKQIRRCRNCGKVGHNVVTCTSKPKQESAPHFSPASELESAVKAKINQTDDLHELFDVLQFCRDTATYTKTKIRSLLEVEV